MFDVYELKIGWIIVPSWNPQPTAKTLLFKREGAARAARALSRYITLTRSLEDGGAGLSHAHAMERMHKEGV